jgi:hypothetical protein
MFTQLESDSTTSLRFEMFDLSIFTSKESIVEINLLPDMIF